MNIEMTEGRIPILHSISIKKVKDAFNTYIRRNSYTRLFVKYFSEKIFFRENGTWTSAKPEPVDNKN